MAEIRSTMDLVMERAARMGKASSEELSTASSSKQGMLAAAEFLNGRTDSGAPPAPLSETLEQYPQADQTVIRKGMLETLLRNIFIPRDAAAQERIARALDGILSLGGGAGEIKAICDKLQSLTSQYTTQREQYREQLKQQIQMQIEQVLAQKGLSSKGLNIDPTMEPQFQEEWSRIEGELNSQYERTLQQYRAHLKQGLEVV
ncbi:MAG: hypothetical protein CSA33_04290 [Desulfobulbus propionicus]|nr:MAG: hypothetical protein CSA33_04290 [Desulfobulbus propionicus]